MAFDKIDKEPRGVLDRGSHIPQQQNSDFNYLNNHRFRIAKKLCKGEDNWRWSCSAVVPEMAHRAAKNLNFIVVRMWKNA